ncbi:hypothetical protein PHMEG_00012382 [Phytophthora megakarya]|uniref:MULE transposase domain-containing protein n=1 Tax=Phytophthora megakarya TaxID=4795 RepID=A0A225WAK7_9STRA|nr:hypothetical protein PHMEG_00012382 [Phytophthora megakarya]
MNGEHTMADPKVPSPKSQQLALQMRAFIDERLGEDGTIEPLDLFARLIKKVENGVFEGPPPEVSQVQAYVKMAQKQQTRCNEACFGVMCKQHHKHGMLVPNLGTTPLFDLDSPVLHYWMATFLFNVTHDVPHCSTSTVPTTSENKNILSLCLVSLTAAAKNSMGVLLYISIQLCWSHVCQNVKDHITKAKLAPVTIGIIFRDLSTLHIARPEEEYLVQRAHVLAAWRSASTFCSSFQVVADHIIKLDTTSKVFVLTNVSHATGLCHHHQPLGAVPSYFKIGNKAPKVMSTEMLERLDTFRLGFIHVRSTFSSTPVVSEWLKAPYKLTVRNKQLCATSIGSSSDMPVQLMTILHHPRKPFSDRHSDDADGFYFDDPSKVSKP